MRSSSFIWFRLRGFVLAGIALVIGEPVFAQGSRVGVLAERIRNVMERPEFAHASFGIEFYSPETDEVIYALNEHGLFTPASTTKLLTEGSLTDGRRCRCRSEEQVHVEVRRASASAGASASLSLSTNRTSMVFS